MPDGVFFMSFALNHMDSSGENHTESSSKEEATELTQANDSWEWTWTWCFFLRKENATEW